LIVFPQRSARYEKRVDFLAAAQPVVARELPREWARAIEQAMRTARARS
jgi:hypothetical protein